MKTKPLTFLLSLTFLFLFSGSVFGQEEVKKEYWGNGKLKSEEHYKNGKMHGLTANWYESGKKASEYYYKDGKSEGLWTVWYANGKKELETHYKDDYENGLSTRWYESGEKKLEMHYEDGSQSGLETSWYKNGQKHMEGNYIDFYKVGIFTEWYENGNKKVESNFKSNYLSGLETRWFQSGKKYLGGNYKDGLPVGLWTEWNEDGTIKFKKEQEFLEVILKEGANPYESSAIASALKDDLTFTFQGRLENDFTERFYDCEKEDTSACRHHLKVSIHFDAASVDLNDDNKDEVIVRKNDSYGCGSGGCGTYILQKFKGAWKGIGFPTGGYNFLVSNIQENGYFPVYYTTRYGPKKWSFEGVAKIE